MDKRKQKRENYNTEILNALKEKYGFGYDYIIKSIRGDRDGIVPNRIKKDYKIMLDASLAASKEIIKSKIQEL